MTTTLYYVACSAALTWVAIMMGSFVRNRLWTGPGMKVGLSNRDRSEVPPATALSGRVDRAAANTIEGFVIFAALALTAHVAGLDNDRVALAATIFFWARLAYLPMYYAGITGIRTLFWFASVIAQVMILLVLLTA